MQNHVLDYLYETVERVPDKPAFVDETEAMTFRRLYDTLHSVATGLMQGGYSHEPVLVFMDKSVRTIATFFGVIASGCFYVPIDEEMPAARIRLILENCKPRLMICDETTIDKAQTFAGDTKCVLYDDIIRTQPEYEKIREICRNAMDIDPIYIVFTSGSTGVPKGVAACHRSVIDYVEQLSETLGFSEDTVFGNQSPLYFDACLKELYPTIKFGATTYLVPRQLFMFPAKLVEYLNEKKINTICWVVSALTMISAYGTFEQIRPEYLKTVAFGSEVFPKKQFKLWREALPEAHFTNLYGPTECTGMSCYFHVERSLEEDEPIPIGRPFKNTQILLLTDDNRLASGDETGEICIRGTCVTLGYYNNPEKTREAFVQNPLQSAYPELIYRTGDLGRYNERGELVFVSRKDYQIKHMGHRIELGEIEANVNSVDGVKLCGCIYYKEKERIILYYVGDPDKAALMAELKDMLPRYMLPNRIEKLDEMPFTANGKINRVRLKEMYEELLAEKKESRRKA
ncbi:MAG: amino acid adenylation domain-containing protein [Lachnospiraceae bacterium]|nr:amino acid adenylation domain-containing protein [Lachnospiraceae bacterium]